MQLTIMNSWMKTSNHGPKMTMQQCAQSRQPNICCQGASLSSCAFSQHGFSLNVISGQASCGLRFIFNHLQQPSNQPIRWNSHYNRDAMFREIITCASQFAKRLLRFGRCSLLSCLKLFDMSNHVIDNLQPSGVSNGHKFIPFMIPVRQKWWDCLLPEKCYLNDIAWVCHQVLDTCSCRHNYWTKQQYHQLSCFQVAPGQTLHSCHTWHHLCVT